MRSQWMAVVDFDRLLHRFIIAGSANCEPVRTSRPLPPGASCLASAESLSVSARSTGDILPLIMNFDDVRRLTIVAMFSDDSLMERVVLKGGNALTLVYQIGARASLDVDFSIDGDFEDFEDTRERIFRSLAARFGATGYVVFDETFERRPSINGSGAINWGGYVAEFKLIEKAKFDEGRANLDSIRRNALVTGPLQRKIFRIELSKYEFCQGKAEHDLDDYTIYVYTPEMIAVEKLRAICQQLPEYKPRVNKTARARDFYDIHSLVTHAGVKLAAQENIELARNIFAAKEVPLALLPRIKDSLEQHRPDWPSVVASVSAPLMPFDDYFNFVTKEIESLEPLWKE
jgi:predicted nucleotidyltransferase component of viral defense system